MIESSRDVDPPGYIWFVWYGENVLDRNLNGP